ncbi:MAG: cupin domain-containing protein [Prolixibacteraceae bacterium]|jgi:mannose-6-phosphate isomerase-like protein (cupin superfamily)|nr:cupin domain-containing protein [Prolixibacteraceae bacterium]
MLIKKITETDAFVAGDETLLKEVLNPSDKACNIRYSLAHAVVKPGQCTLPHRLRSSETYYVLSGKGEVSINSEKQIISANELVYIPPMALQNICNVGETDLVFLCICDPAWRKKDEIVE